MNLHGVGRKNLWLTLRRQPQIFQNVTLVARQREHFQDILAIFLVAEIPPKTVFSYTRI